MMVSPALFVLKRWPKWALNWHKRTCVRSNERLSSTLRCFDVIFFDLSNFFDHVLDWRMKLYFTCNQRSIP